MHHEGEILLKEKYGSSQEIIYVKPHNQSKIAAVRVISISSTFEGWFKSVFLPQGYPDSVSPDYTQYQIWDTAQAFCSTITGTLATQEVLRGVGVGDTTATPVAATITWILKDGCGHVGRIVFAWSHGTQLDAYSKKWRLYADCLNDAAMCMEMALPYFKGYTTSLLCFTTMMKAVVGVAGGATRAALTQHHAVRYNMADVAAKDSAQETAVNLVASLVALAIITVLGNSLMIFALMVVLHIVCNYLAVRSVCLRTFNEPRFLQTIHRYLKHQLLSTPCFINRQEPIIFYQMGGNFWDLHLCGFQIRLGQSMETVLQEDSDYEKINALKSEFAGQKYMLYPQLLKRQMYVMLVEDATPEDILLAYYHAVLLSTIISSLNFCPLSVYKMNANMSPFVLICRALQTADWSCDEGVPSAAAIPSDSATFSFTDSFNREALAPLRNLVNRMAQKEWAQLRVGLRSVGWNLDKHLLMLDEWRVEADVERSKSDPRATLSQPLVFSDPVDTPNCEVLEDLLSTFSRSKFTNKLNDHQIDNVIEPELSTNISKEKNKNV